jgi:hypothetical protein
MKSQATVERMQGPGPERNDFTTVTNDFEQTMNGPGFMRLKLARIRAASKVGI